MRWYLPGCQHTSRMPVLCERTDRIVERCVCGTEFGKAIVEPALEAHLRGQAKTGGDDERE